MESSETVGRVTEHSLVSKHNSRIIINMTTEYYLVTSIPCCPGPSPRLKNNTHCGLRGRDSLLKSVTGAGLVQNSLPWTCALLKHDNRWRGCGATLLNCKPVIIVTAAHCVDE